MRSEIEAGATFDLKVLTPSELLYEGRAHGLTFPGRIGEGQILPGHATMTALLGPGEVVIEPGGRRFPVAGGLVRVRDDGVVVLAKKSGPKPADRTLENSA